MYSINLRNYVQLGEWLRHLKIVSKLESKRTDGNTPFKNYYFPLLALMKILREDEISESVYKEIKYQTITLHKKYKEMTSPVSSANSKNLHEKIIQWERLLKEEVQYISCFNFDYDANINIGKLKNGVKTMYEEMI